MIATCDFGHPAFSPCMRGSRGGGRGEGVPDPLGICKAYYRSYYWKSKYKLFFIFVHFHSYTSRLDPPWTNFLVPNLPCTADLNNLIRVMIDKQLKVQNIKRIIDCIQLVEYSVNELVIMTHISTAQQAELRTFRVLI